MFKEQTKFIFDRYEFSADQGTAHFYYTLKKDAEIFHLKETLSFPISGINDTNIFPEALRAVLESLLLILGISYWKVFCPSEIELSDIKLSKEQADFWNTVYTKGLGEFFYKNQIDFRGLIKFPYSTQKESTKRPASSPEIKTPERALLLFGGGKDSIVSAELLKEHNKKFTIFTLNEYALQNSLITQVGADHLVIQRQLDPQLFELNKRTDAYNGHIPISAVYGFTAFLGAILYNYNSIVVSNEASADEGNVEYLDTMVNHQWSKSSEFEELMRNYLQKYITSELHYFSLLRNLNELKIVELFSKYPKYFSLFSSCNTNFKILQPTGKKLWCGKCPKCAFVFVLFAAMLPKKEVIEIFGKNLLADKTLIPLYRELLGLERFKPFECVGTPEETQLAFYLAHQQKEYEHDPIMQIFIHEFSIKFPKIETSKVMILASPNEYFMPKEL